VTSFLSFLSRLATHCGIDAKLPAAATDDEFTLAAGILAEINRYFYQRGVGLPREYFSEFHKYWQEHHERILAPRVDLGGQCLKVAKLFETVYQKDSFKVHVDTLGLSKQDIANVRFFTAIQDFNIDLQAKSNPFELFKRFPDCFDPAKVIANELLVDQFLSLIGAEAQRDKRKPWMVNAARLLIENYRASAYAINQVHGGDIAEIERALTSEDRYGFSAKKTHMFLRDMADLDVWRYEKNIETLDVMSDKNTMRVALRTGILRFRMPLLASFLDVYCYQYEMVDRLSRESWREVWRQWATLDANHRPPTPASMDYLVYRLGKVVCRPSRRRCPPEKPMDAKKVQSLIAQERLFFTSDLYCILSSICPSDCRLLNAPKSISIEGKTGWKSATTNAGGGGGLSS
jgi:hypothetical protein